MRTYDDPSLFAFNDPRALPLEHVGLELVFFGCLALTLRDVAARYRRGERYALFQWLLTLAYGVLMELVAFNAYPDYEHAQFSAELYHRKLPLYITAVYVVFHYTGWKLVERRRLGALGEAVVTGLSILLLDVSFDVAGAEARWWWWLPSGRDVTVRWLGVPLTSFEWYLIFGAVLAGVGRALRRRIEPRPALVYVALAPLVAVAVIVLGVVAFLPFHALEAIGLPDALLVAAHAAACVLVAVKVRGGAEETPRSWPLALIPAVLATWDLGVLVAHWESAGISQGGTKVMVSVVAVAATFALFVGRSAVAGRSSPASASVVTRVAERNRIEPSPACVSTKET
jgi:hypothetical protein